MFEPGATETIHETLLSGAREVRFKYFVIGRGNVGRWQSEWNNPAILPRGVALQVLLPGSDAPVELVFRTTTALPSACVAMPDEPYCS